MKKLFFVLLIFLINNSFAQAPNIRNMDECEFFDYLKEVKTGEYKTNSYLALFEPKNEIQKFIFLKRLESYLVAFASDNVAPMYLDTLKNEQKHEETKRKSFKERQPFYCEQLVKKYYELRNTYKIQDSRDRIQDGNFENIRYLLIDLTDLNKRSNSQLERAIAEFDQSYTLQYLYSCIKDVQDTLPKFVTEQNKKFIIDRIDKQGQKVYTHYENYSSKPNVLKGYEMYHENDVLLPTFWMNQDREMTGAFKFSVFTDYFKCRFLPLGNKKITEQNILTYQTISIGGNGYTPYIRYYNNNQLADSIHQFDRPFCSYIYLERAKNRVWLKGLVRQKGEIQGGMIGTNGYLVQAQIHEDVNESAQHVYGWDKQIAEEGRIFLQVNQKWEFLLFSTNNDYKTIFHPQTIKVANPNAKKSYPGINFSSEVDVRYGSLMTTLGGGFRFSTLNFLQQSGHQMIASNPKYNNNYGWKVDLGINYRYVVHNSTLEGLGFTKTFPHDIHDIVKQDDYVLNDTLVNKHLLIVDVGFNFKWRKTTIFYKFLFHTIEYQSNLSKVDYSKYENLVATEDKEYYHNTIQKEQNDFLNTKFMGMQWYGYGTIGLSWIID